MISQKCLENWKKEKITGKRRVVFIFVLLLLHSSNVVVLARTHHHQGGEGIYKVIGHGQPARFRLHVTLEELLDIEDGVQGLAPIGLRRLGQAGEEYGCRKSGHKFFVLQDDVESPGADSEAVPVGISAPLDRYPDLEAPPPEASPLPRTGRP